MDTIFYFLLLLLLFYFASVLDSTSKCCSAEGRTAVKPACRSGAAEGEVMWLVQREVQEGGMRGRKYGRRNPRPPPSLKDSDQSQPPPTLNTKLHLLTSNLVFIRLCLLPHSKATAPFLPPPPCPDLLLATAFHFSFLHFCSFLFFFFAFEQYPEGSESSDTSGLHLLLPLLCSRPSQASAT